MPALCSLHPTMAQVVNYDSQCIVSVRNQLSTGINYRPIPGMHIADLVSGHILSFTTISVSLSSW